MIDLVNDTNPNYDLVTVWKFHPLDEVVSWTTLLQNPHRTRPTLTERQEQIQAKDMSSWSEHHNYQYPVASNSLTSCDEYHGREDV